MKTTVRRGIAGCVERETQGVHVNVCLPAGAARSCVQPTVVSQQRDGRRASSHPVIQTYRVDGKKERIEGVASL